jgi:phospholipid transport system transporter-binding protein
MKKKTKKATSRAPAKTKVKRAAVKAAPVVVAVAEVEAEVKNEAEAEVIAEAIAAEPATVVQDTPEVASVAAAPAAPAAATTGRRAGLKLDPTCLVRDSADLQFQLLAADFGSGDVLVDGSAVDRVDTAGLQLITAFVRYQEGRGRSVGWTAASNELLKAARQLGLSSALHLDGLAVEGAP